MKNYLTLILILLLIPIVSSGQFDNYQTFEQLDSLSRVHSQSNNLDSAILAIEFGLDKFPEHDENATFILGLLYTRANQDTQALKNWTYGQKKRYFYGLNNRQFRNHFKDYPEFELIAAVDKTIGDSLDNASHLEYEVIIPKGYSADKIYPTLFVFHGNNRNIRKAKTSWTSDIMTRNCIVVFMQSYIHMYRYDYKWVINDQKTNEEFKEIYGQIIKEYRVNKDKIILLGMSAGGRIATDYAFSQFIPASGLVLNCPVIPEISEEAIQSFVNKNYKLGIITGEKDFALNDQKTLISKLKDKGGEKYRITEIEGLGHQFGENFSILLDDYLNWVLE